MICCNNLRLTEVTRFLAREREREWYYYDDYLFTSFWMVYLAVDFLKFKNRKMPYQFLGKHIGIFKGQANKKV